MLTARSPLAAHPSRARLTGHAGHMHGFTRASSQLQRTQAVRRPIYGREFEKDQLDRALKQRPRDMLVILGPRDCGKTAVLESFLEGKRHVLYLDCRGMDSRNPTAFTASLLWRLECMLPSSLFNPRLAMLKRRLRELQLRLLQLPAAASKGPEQANAAPADLSEVFETLSEVFDAWKQEAQRNPTDTYGPVLVIDEANMFMRWAERLETHPAGPTDLELRSLLDFFVKITKQEQQCHVVLVTAESAFQTWLDKRLGSGSSGFWRPEVIGDFTESEARDFLFQELGGVSSSDGTSIDQDDKAWAAVYEVCGGNANALSRLVNRLRVNPGFGWEKALEELWKGAAQRNRLSRLLMGRKGFEPVHYAAAALKLLDSQQTWNTVRMRDMQELLGRYVEGAASEEDARAAGAAVLESLVQATALSVRPPSNWARDIPVQAFGDDGGSIVTAHSTMDLYCWRRMRPELEKVLEEHDSAQ